MMKMRKLKDGVYFPAEEIVFLSQSDFDELKDMAKKSPRGRIILCSHQKEDDEVHELLIVMTKGVYNRPHRHINKGESLYFIEGSAELYLFDMEGHLQRVIPVGEKSTGRVCYYRIPGADYHVLRVTSEFIVFHETTKGPFDKENKINAPWAPDEKETEKGHKFFDNLAVGNSVNFKKEAE